MAWMEQVERGVEFIPPAVDGVALLVFLTGFIKAIVLWIGGELGGRCGKESRFQTVKEIRILLGTYILLGLEVMIISDVVHSCLHRDLLSLAELGGLVLVRTFIGFFLGKELEHIHDTRLAES